VSPRRGLRLTAVIAAGLCVLAIAAGVIVFSYSDVRDTALTAGLSPRLARFYPLLFDAVLIVACAAAVTLRGVLRGYAWLAVLVTVGAIAAADIVHVMSITVPKRPLEATIAVAPWVVLLVGLTLLDAMLRRGPGRKSQAEGRVLANGGGPAAGFAESATGLTAGVGAVPLSTLLHDLPPASGRRARAAARRAAADANRGGITAGQPEADVSPARAAASEPAAEATPDWAYTGEPAAGASPDRAYTSEPAASASPDRAYTSEPAAGASPDWAYTSEPAAGASPDWASGGEPAGDADQPEVAASLPQNGADPAAAEPGEDRPGEG
jgi:hypothetical protein